MYVRDHLVKLAIGHIVGAFLDDAVNGRPFNRRASTDCADTCSHLLVLHDAKLMLRTSVEYEPIWDDSLVLVSVPSLAIPMPPAR